MVINTPGVNYYLDHEGIQMARNLNTTDDGGEKEENHEVKYYQCTCIQVTQTVVEENEKERKKKKKAPEGAQRSSVHI